MRKVWNRFRKAGHGVLAIKATLTAAMDKCKFNIQDGIMELTVAAAKCRDQCRGTWEEGEAGSEGVFEARAGALPRRNVGMEATDQAGFLQGEQRQGGI